MHIVLQVINPPYSYEDMDSAIKIADAALKKGHKVSIFLFADSVLSVNTKVRPIRIDRNIPNLLKDLADRGAEIHICGLCLNIVDLTLKRLRQVLSLAACLRWLRYWPQQIATSTSQCRRWLE